MAGHEAPVGAGGSRGGGGALLLSNALIDDVMPALRDTELRVLLVVLRQTLGRREPRGDGTWAARRRDWLSHAQLRRRTGRGSEAVSAAIAALVERGFIVVEDAAGVPLATTAERRRALSRLYFRPGDMWITALASRNGNAKTTKYRRNVNKWGGFDKPAPPPLRLRNGGWSRAGDPSPGEAGAGK
jgi:hypothetical protein